MEIPAHVSPPTQGGFDPEIHLVPASVYKDLTIPRITMEELGFSETSLTKVVVATRSWSTTTD